MAVWFTTTEIRYAAPGGPGFCTHFWRDAGAGAEFADLQDATDALQAAWNRMSAVLPTTTSVGGDGIWKELDGPREVDTARTRAAGTLNAATLLSGNNSIVIGWRTADRSRSGRGRTYISGFGTAASGNGVPVAGVVSAAQQMGQDLVDFNEAALNGAFVIHSRVQNISRDITSFSVRPIWASLRSRRD